MLIITFNREKSCKGHGKGYGELPDYTSDEMSILMHAYYRFDYLLQYGMCPVVRFAKFEKCWLTVRI